MGRRQLLFAALLSRDPAINFGLGHADDFVKRNLHLVETVGFFHMAKQEPPKPPPPIRPPVGKPIQRIEEHTQKPPKNPPPGKRT